MTLLRLHMRHLGCNDQTTQFRVGVTVPDALMSSFFKSCDHHGGLDHPYPTPYPKQYVQGQPLIALSGDTQVRHLHGPLHNRVRETRSGSTIAQMLPLGTTRNRCLYNKRFAGVCVELPCRSPLRFTLSQLLHRIFCNCSIINSNRLTLMLGQLSWTAPTTGVTGATASTAPQLLRH
jgi:hypothetical protein